MKIKQLTISCLLTTTLLTVSYRAFSQNTYQQQIHWEGGIILDAFTTSDSGKIFTGGYGLFAAGSSPYGNGAALIKLDKLGNPSWQKLYSAGVGQSFSIEGYEVLQTADEGYLIAGLYVDKNYAINAAPYFVKTDKNGTMQWAKIISNKGFYDFSDPNYAYWDQFVDVQETKDGGYICVGHTSMFGTKGDPQAGNTLKNRPTDVWLIKLSAVGKIEWTKTYGNKSLWEEGAAVRQTADGGYIISGTAQIALSSTPLRSLNDNRYGILLKTDDKGVVQWQKKYDMVKKREDSILWWNDGHFSSLQITADSGFIVSGQYIDGYNSSLTGSGYQGDQEKTSLLKTDKNGNVVWFNVYDFPSSVAWQQSYYTKVLQTADGSCVLSAGISTYNGAQALGASVVLKTDEFGIPAWAKTYGNGGSNGLADYSTTLVDYDGGYFIWGNPYIPTTENIRGMLLTKTDTNGNVAGCEAAILVSVTSHTLGVSPWTSSTGAGGSFETTGSEQTFSITDTIGCFGLGVTASFSGSGRCLPDSVVFLNTSTGTAFNWNFGDPASGTADSSNLFNPRHLYTAAGTYTVTLTATDTGTGNTNTATGLVTLLALTPVSLIDKTIPYSGTYCTGNPNSVFDTTNSLEASFNYYPDGLSMVNNYTGEIDFSKSTPGNYTLIYANSPYSCTIPDTINITIAQAPGSVFSYTPIVYCQYDVNPLPVLDAGSVSGVFSATPAGLVFKNAFTGEIDLAASGQGTYVITNTVNDSINFPVCPSSSNIFYLTVANCTTCSITLSTSKTDVSCDSTNNGTASVTVIDGSGLYQYAWNTNPVQTTQTVTNLTQGAYTVTVNDIGIFADTLELVSNGDFSAGNTGFYSAYTYSPDATAKGQYNVYADAIYWNQIDYNNTLIGRDHTTGSGNFMLVSGSATANALVWCDTVNVNPNTAYLFSAWLSSLDTLSPGEVAITVNGESISKQFTAPATTGSWQQIAASWYSGLNTSAVFCITNQNTSSDPGNWYGLDDISLVRFSGSITSCEQTDTVRIEFFQDNAVFIPTAFSPNNDGYNELECVFGSACVQSFRFAIFDRWGNNVFETDEPELCWDGTFKGKAMSAAVFVYYLSAVLTNGDAINQKGNISLIR